MKLFQLLFLSVLPLPVILLALPAVATTGSGQKIDCVDTTERIQSGSGKLMSCIPLAVVSFKTGKNVPVSCEKGAVFSLFDDGTLASCVLTSDRTFYTGKSKSVSCNRASPVSLFPNGNLKSCSPTSEQVLPTGAGPSRGCGPFREVSLFQSGNLASCWLSRDETVQTESKTVKCQKGQSITLSDKGQMVACK